MSQEGTRLVVVENADGGTTDADDDSMFAIYDEICEYETDDAKSILGEFVRADVESSFPYPVYPVLLPDLCERFGYGRSSFVYGILLFGALGERLETGDVSHVTTGDVHPFFEMVVLDACRQSGVETTVSPPRRRRANVISYLSILVSLVPFFFDQMFSLVYKRFVDRPNSAETVFVVFPDRFDSVRPVIDEMTDAYEVVTTPTTVAHLRTSRFRRLIEQYDASPMNLFVTLPVLAAELRFLLGSVRREVVGDRQLERELWEFVFRQYGFDLTYASWWLVNDTLTGAKVRSLLYYFVFEALFEDLGCRKFVTNSFATKGRSIMAAGDQRQLEHYHVPHSLLHGGFMPPPSVVTTFAPGRMEQKYLSDRIDFVEDNVIAVLQGRPYLSELYHDRDRYPVTEVRDNSDSCLVTLATQPFEDEARERLVEGVLAATERLDEQPTLLIKTHPSEDPSFYDAYREAHDNVVVKSDDLFSVLVESDVVVTVNSNVGLESMLLGTPNLCFNEWETMMWNMPFTDLGPVPVFESSSEFGEYLASLTEDDLQSLARRQQEFVEANYALDDAASGIAAVIEDGPGPATGPLHT